MVFHEIMKGDCFMGWMMFDGYSLQCIKLTIIIIPAYSSEPLGWTKSACQTIATAWRIVWMYGMCDLMSTPDFAKPWFIN